jgi:hypothetical protein
MQIPTLIFVSTLVCCSYYISPYFELRDSEALMYNYPINNTCNFQSQKDVPCYRGPLDFVLTTYIVLCWLGMWIVAIFGGVGLINMPYDYMNEFIYRPKPVTPEDFKKRTKVLLPIALKLRDQGKVLDD